MVRMCARMMGEDPQKMTNGVHPFFLAFATRIAMNQPPPPPLSPLLTPHENCEILRFLPDAEYGIALDNLIKGCTDVLLGHPDRLRIFVGRQCVQRERVVFFIASSSPWFRSEEILHFGPSF
jgi:hypothetical protein